MKQNVILLAVNISRAYEIAMAGEHSLSIVCDKSLSDSPDTLESNCKFLRDYYKAMGTLDADIVVEMHEIPVSDILHSFTGKGETLGDILERVQEAKGDKRPVEIVLSGSVGALLNSTIEKLSLSVRQVNSVLAVSKTIAKLSNSIKVLPEHIAEAIMYQSFKQC